MLLILNWVILGTVFKVSSQGSKISGKVIVVIWVGDDGVLGQVVL